MTQAGHEGEGSFYHQHYISVDQVTSRSQFEDLAGLALQMEATNRDPMWASLLTGAFINILFYQPSTRTFSSLERSPIIFLIGTGTFLTNVGMARI